MRRLGLFLLAAGGLLQPLRRNSHHRVGAGLLAVFEAVASRPSARTLLNLRDTSRVRHRAADALTAPAIH